MNKETVLVTGGAGFIGSHLCELLLSESYDVRVLDDLSQGDRSYIPDGVEFIQGSITDIQTCRRAVEGVNGVFHLAAMSKVAPSIEKIEFCTEQNVLGTQNVLIAARDAKVRKVVYSGSSTYYGNRKAPQQEDLLPECLNPYALSKYVGEQYCELFSRLYQVPTVVLRYFNVYGPRQPRTGAYALVLGIFLDQHGRGTPLTIHGDGSQRRDFIHVRDVARANLLAFRSQAQGTVFNVGSGTNISIKDLASLIQTEHVHEPRRAGDAEVTLADIRRIQEYLNWVPKVSLEEGLAELKAAAIGRSTGDPKDR